MILFDEKGYEYFFRPLCSKNKRIYYECIKKLIDKTDRDPDLYETEAKDILTLYFRNCKYVVEDESNQDNIDGLNSNMDPQQSANFVLRYFRKCAWLSEKELGRNGENISHVNLYCSKLILAIDDIFKQEHEGELSNSILAIYDVLKSVRAGDKARLLRPYTSVLVPIENSIRRLRNEITTLKQNIHQIMRTIREINEIDRMGQFLLKDELLKKFFGDFFFVKKDGLIPGYIEEIEKILRVLTGSDIYKKIIEEYASRENIDIPEATEIISQRFEDIRYYISYRYDKEMDYIDNKINNYYNLYSTRMHMIMSNGINTQILVNNTLLTLKNLSEDDRAAMLSDLFESFNVYSYKHMVSKSLEKRKRITQEKTGGVIKKTQLSAEEIEKRSREILDAPEDKYSYIRTVEHFNKAFGKQKKITPGKENIKSNEDMYMMTSALIYAQSEDFPYKAVITDGHTEVNGIRFRNFELERREQ